MKKFQFFYISLVALTAHAQSTDRNDVIIGVAPSAVLNYYGNVDTTGPFGAGSGHWGMRTPVSLEYSFGRFAGISADFVYTRLSAGTTYRSNFTVLDFGLGMRWHTPSDKQRINWFGEVGVHYSKLHYFFHDDSIRETTDAKGWSLYSDVGANVPLSASGKFGMGLSLNGSAYKYRTAHYENDQGGNADFKMNALSFAVGINLYYKL